MTFMGLIYYHCNHASTVISDLWMNIWYVAVSLWSVYGVFGFIKVWSNWFCNLCYNQTDLQCNEPLVFFLGGGCNYKKYSLAINYSCNFVMLVFEIEFGLRCGSSNVALTLVMLHLFLETSNYICILCHSDDLDGTGYWTTSYWMIMP